MIFTDERDIWFSDQDELASKLANKSHEDIFNILEDYKSILVVSGSPRYTATQRLIQLLSAPLIPFLILLMGVKWVLTGDKYLDSWLKRIGLTTEITRKYFL
jgi:hypothetical protein